MKKINDKIIWILTREETDAIENLKSLLKVKTRTNVLRIMLKDFYDKEIQKLNQTMKRLNN